MDTSPDSMEARMTKIETIIPTLATKTDLANLRIEIQNDMQKLQHWIFGVLMAIIFGFTGMIGVMFSLYSRAPGPAAPAPVAVQSQPDPIVIVIPAISLAQPAKP